MHLHGLSTIFDTLPLGNVDVLIRRPNSVTKRIQAVLELVHRDILLLHLKARAIDGGPMNMLTHRHWVWNLPL